jgi:TRAP-type C4-dicarboxylate transport system permease small subunit
MLARAKKASGTLSLALSWTSAAVVCFFAGFVTYSTVSRYVFGKAVPFMEEVAGILVIVLAFNAFAYVFLKGGHIRVTHVMGKVSPKARQFMDLGAHLVALVYTAVFIVLAWDFVVRSYRLDCHTATAGLYSVPFMAVMVLGAGVFALVVLVSCVEVARNLIIESRKSASG